MQFKTLYYTNVIKTTIFYIYSDYLIGYSISNVRFYLIYIPNIDIYYTSLNTNIFVFYKVYYKIFDIICIFRLIANSVYFFIKTYILLLKNCQSVH